MKTKHLLCALLLSILLLCQLCTPADSVKVIFYNRKPTIHKSQLLITEKRTKPCPAGKMRDHRNRCRRALIFCKKPSN